MAFEKGHAKVGGRQKGVANKQTQDLQAICDKHDVHPFEALILLYKEGGWDPHMKLAALKEICQYLYPKRKAIEHSGEINTNPYLEKSLEELEELVKEKLEK